MLLRKKKNNNKNNNYIIVDFYKVFIIIHISNFFNIINN